MKKLICVLLLIVVLASLLAGCGKFECDLCGEEKTGKQHKEEIAGEELVICDDCYETLEDLVNAFS